MKRLKAFLRGFIPGHVSSKIVLGFLNFFSFRIPKRLREKHYEHNLEQWDLCRARAEKAGFLEHQELLSVLPFGNRPASVNSCEVIAVYNAWKALGKEVSFPELLKKFEQMGLCLFGAFGTAPKKLHRYFREQGEETKVLIGKAVTEKALAALERNYQTFLVTAYNDRSNIMAMIHTMCISRESAGFVVHNSVSANGTHASLGEALSALGGGKALPICLLGVGERR